MWNNILLVAFLVCVGGVFAQREDAADVINTLLEGGMDDMARQNISTNATTYDAYTGKPLANQTLPPICLRRVNPCSAKSRRTIDGSCNNLQHPSRGMVLTPFRRVLPPAYATRFEHRVSKSGMELPEPRPLRTALLSEGRTKGGHLTHLVTIIAVGFVGEYTSLHDTVNYVVLTTDCCVGGPRRDRRCQSLRVPDDDPLLSRTSPPVSCLNLTRSITYQRLGCLSANVPPERISFATPMLDHSFVYGTSESMLRQFRAGRGGELRSERDELGREWPPSGFPLCLNNQLPQETRCHNTPNPGSNALLGNNLWFMWQFREHNRIARALAAINPCWDDEQLFTVTRDITIATAVQIYYYELFKLLLGEKYGVESGALAGIEKGFDSFDDYDPRLEPAVSIDFVTATRWFHKLQAGEITLYENEGKKARAVGSRTIVDLTLRTGTLPINRTIERITQGTFREAGQRPGTLVDPDMAERILGRMQLASDVFSSDITKGRDFGLSSYNQYRRFCGLQAARKFHDFADVFEYDIVEILSEMYESPEDVELMVGLYLERSVKSGYVGPVMACLVAEQLVHWRRSDRWWYERPHHTHASSFTPDQLQQVRKMTVARLLCDSGDGVTHIQPNAFLLPNTGNKIVPCDLIPSMDLTVWKDIKCNNEKNISDSSTKTKN